MTEPLLLTGVPRCAHLWEYGVVLRVKARWPSWDGRPDPPERRFRRCLLCHLEEPLHVEMTTEEREEMVRVLRLGDGA